MKRLLMAIFLLLFSLIYVVARVTHKSLYLPEMYAHANNPVSFHWNVIAIDTKILSGTNVDIYLIWMTPVYLLVLIALILTFLEIKKRK